MTDPRIHGDEGDERIRTAVPDGTNDSEYEPPVLTLEWFCVACGWRTTVDAPGFAGDGHYHYIRGKYPCGPLLARRTWVPARAAVARAGTEAAL